MVARQHQLAWQTSASGLAAVWATDNTREVLARYAHDPRVRIIFNSKNEGNIGARNHGLRIARGEYVGVLDADDFCLRPNALERHVAVLDAEPEVAESVAGYVELARKFTPQGAHYLENHRGHLMVLRPEEHEVCTADLIRTLTFTATAPELRERLRELRRAGYNHFAVSIRHGHPEMLEEWADVFEGV